MIYQRTPRNWCSHNQCRFPTLSCIFQVLLTRSSMIVLLRSWIRASSLQYRPGSCWAWGSIKYPRSFQHENHLPDPVLVKFDSSLWSSLGEVWSMRLKCRALYFPLLVFFFFLNNFWSYFYLFIYLFMAVLGLRFCARAFSSCSKRGPLFIAVRGPLTIAAPLVAEHRLQTRRLSSCGSRA